MITSRTLPTNTYASLQEVYDVFNTELFDDTLPPCLITMQRHKGAFGYFSGNRFANVADVDDVTDEIALNPMYFATRTPEQILSTLVHEMVHLWQQHHGTPSRTSYHNKEWAAKMHEVGLTPTDTGAPGGKETGQKMTHIITADGRFAHACARVIAEHPALLYSDRASDDDSQKARKKSASKSKYTCSGCGLNAWAKPEAALWCGTCQQPMTAEEQDEM